MAAETSSKHSLQLYLGPLVGLLILLFSLTEFYERAELVTNDWRFNIRNTLFGIPPMDPRLGTIDIDDRSIEAEGRYQDWTRDKYTEVVRILSMYGAHTVAFDIYFADPSAKVVTEDQLRKLSDYDAESLERLIASVDYDEQFRQVLIAADNVYLAQYSVISGDKALRSPDQDEALQTIRQRSPRLLVDAEQSTLTRITDFTPPLKMLRNAARGFAFAQSIPDVDGTRRRYPLVYQCEDVVFPSLALMVVCDYLQVPLKRVEVLPGEHVRLPDARLRGDRIKDIEIPIDEHGNMNVNWVGEWVQTFNHYPHILLRWVFRQQLLEKTKELLAADPTLLKQTGIIFKTLNETGFLDREENRKALITWVRARGIEQAILQDPQLDAEAFWRSKGLPNPGQEQLYMFNQIKLNNRLADQLASGRDPETTELKTLFPDFSSEDIAAGKHFIRSHLTDGQLVREARPLYFYPFAAYEGRLLYPDEIKGKILLYGLTATGTEDLNVTPFQGDYPMVGIYPNVLNTILNEQFITHIPTWMDAVLIVALGVLLSLVVPRLKVLHGAALVAAVVLFYAVIAFFSFTHLGLWLDMVGPLTTLIVGYLALTIYGYVIKEKEKDFVQGAFGHYLSPAVVDQIMENPEMVEQLGGEERVMTAFFSDIASFSTISEYLTPGELVQFINEYLSEMCDIIEHYGGTIDKFEGDAIVAFFGAPIFYEDHAMRAVLSCIDQQHQLVELRQRWSQDGAIPPRLEELRQRWEAQGRTFTHVRMGVTAGPMIVGNMGSKNRTDYTMMGDTVNLAARFESGQKIYGTGIMVNDLIYEQIKDAVETRKLDVIQVMGKEEPVIAYEVLDRKGALSPEKYQILELFNQGLEAYNAFQFSEAQKVFEQALEIDPADGPSALYADRCEEFAAHPPQDLIFRAETK